MIFSFRHKGLKRLFEDDDAKGIAADLRGRIEVVLTLMNDAMVIEDLNVPRNHLHALKGDRKGQWAVTVRANWRIVFRFEDGAFADVDLVDYH